jgi:protocatechuate 3,4-dioxygenase beta subunit
VASEQLRLYNYMVVVVSTAGTGVLTHSDPLSCTESRQHDQQGSSSNTGETIIFKIVVADAQGQPMVTVGQDLRDLD